MELFMKMLALIARKYLPLTAGLIILIVIAFLAPWDKVGELLERVPKSIFMLLGILSFVYFISKAFSFAASTSATLHNTSFFHIQAAPCSS